MLSPAQDILVCDDNPILRSILTDVFVEGDWQVRTASDGFAALAEMRTRVPHLLLSDLNMDGMSGFELLSIVRRKYPMVPVVAMSGAYSGTDVPHEIAADAFYAKGESSVARLLDVVAELRGKPLDPCSRRAAPIWIPTPFSQRSHCGDLLVNCPECFRSFAVTLPAQERSSSEASCLHCGTSNRYEVVRPTAGRDFTMYNGAAPANTRRVQPFFLRPVATISAQRGAQP